LSQLVKTKRQANFKDFKRFGAFKGLVEQKNVVFNSFVCKLGLFWHSWQLLEEEWQLLWDLAKKLAAKWLEKSEKVVAMESKETKRAIREAPVIKTAKQECNGGAAAHAQQHKSAGGRGQSKRPGKERKIKKGGSVCPLRKRRIFTRRAKQK
jgi:hypothetical protein